MNISPSLAALASAAVVAVVVAFVLRPAQLTVQHPASAPSDALEHAPAAPAERAQTLVYVAGAVVHPGVYALSADARARDALAKAGGATRDADLVAVNLAARVADGDEIAVPRFGEETVGTTARAGASRKTSAAARRTRRRPRRTTASRADAPPGESGSEVNLNTADAAALAELPGIGPTLAERIVEFRSLNGPFASVDGLADVAGITPQRLDALAPLLTTGR